MIDVERLIFDQGKLSRDAVLCPLRDISITTIFMYYGQVI